MFAAAYGSTDAVQLLVDAGADVNAANSLGYTALMWSIAEPAKATILMNARRQCERREPHGSYSPDDRGIAERIGPDGSRASRPRSRPAGRRQDGALVSAGGRQRSQPRAKFASPFRRARTSTAKIMPASLP